MGEKILVGPVNKGLKTDREPFVIDNDSFPTLLNAYQWRGRIKRKRGTSLLNRLKRHFNSTVTSYNSGSTTITLSAAGVGNLLTGFSLQTNGNIVPGSVTITRGANVYTDPAMDGNLAGPNAGTINYATGSFTIVAEAGLTASARFNYYPDLPVMGLEDLSLSSSPFPGTLGFDTKYSYNILSTTPYNIYDVSFYKNPATATYVGYTQKTNITPTTWNGQDYQQFWTTNYQGALWATNGIDIPFTTAAVGMQYKAITTVDNIVAGTPAFADLTITAHGLVVGDFLFINEVSATTGINLQTGYVTAVVSVDKVTVEFPNATIATVGGGGIAQYLTSRADTTKDCLRWYDGDPTDGNATTPVLDGRKGWVNFAPPLSNSNFSIADLPKLQYYLVGARLIVPFKDRLLFFGPVVQTSTADSQVYLQDTVIYSQNGTPYYTASFAAADAAAVLSTSTTFTAVNIPTNQTATATAYFQDVSGYGGFISLGTQEPILTVTSNEDVLILGFTTQQARLVYTGNDIVPFNAFIIDSELGASSTFSAVNLGNGAVTLGSRGIVLTTQVGAQRVDLENPDQVFELNLADNGPQRVSAQRDYVSEWIYFTYPSNQYTYKYPNRTFLYNYRDSSWGIFDECYTTYGQFRKQSGYTWSNIGLTFPTWSEWNEPWNSGSTTLFQPEVIAGNQQGFVLFREDGTTEGNSLAITNLSFAATITGVTQANPCVLTAANTFIVGQSVTISGVAGMTQLNGNTYTVSAVTATTITIQVNSIAFGAYTSGGVATPPQIYSPNHCLNDGDYIVISGVLGTSAAGVNGKIFSVSKPPLITTWANEFVLNPPPASGTYLGGGLIKRMYKPLIQTKQFPVSWGMGRKTRIGAQQYLFTTTPLGQVELQIYLSQNGDSPYNEGPIVPENNVTNNALIYTDILYTCPESTNLGLTAANINLNMVTGSQQQQIWHRMNTSLLGDTVQVGFTLSDAQMRDTAFSNQFTEIELHAMVLDVSPSGVLA